MSTTVINVRGRDRDELLADPNFVYVGRRVPRTRWPDSVWGNPFKIARDIEEQDTIEKVVALFEKHLLSSFRYEVVEPYMPTIAFAFDRMADRRHELRGKTLGCWCCDWSPEQGEPEKPCHAVVLARFADGPLGDPR